MEKYLIRNRRANLQAAGISEENLIYPILVVDECVPAHSPHCAHKGIQNSGQATRILQREEEHDTVKEFRLPVPSLTADIDEEHKRYNLVLPEDMSKW
ncbi:hypothetical protein RRG08_041221 [Elysia crispata]|uniref:Uncharacterized protein n=1 Tax=Elysia crispata TaxID=231223 RepID=A0AAE1AJC5_9GAST|nr:hypothetical protein RRG08_041221 [Elysia crispata]